MHPTETAEVDREGSLETGLRIVLQAEDANTPNPLAAWLAQNPERAAELARFLAAQKQLPPRPVERPQPTSSLDGLQLGEVIGQGAMGVVYRAFDPVLKRDVAVKLVRPGRELSGRELARFQYEAEVVASLDHENVVRIYSSGEVNGEPYLVMPLLTRSLAEHLKSLGPDRLLLPDKAATLVRDIARGVHHAHQRGLIHRDLKPGNILLDHDGTPRIADFGLALPVDVTVSQAVGTPAYMAPQQAAGDKHLTMAVDVYALGVILYELLTGHVPFRGTVSSIMLQLIDPNVQAPPPRNLRPDIPADLEAICLKCLEKNPSQRYASAQALAEDLGRFLNREAVMARLPGLWDWVRQLARVRPDPDPSYSWPVVAWFGAIFLVGGATIFALVRYEVPAAAVWVAIGSCDAAMGVVLWWYMLRRFRQLPVTERHSLILAVGCILAYPPLMITYVPLSLSVPAREALGFYPALAAVSALGLFTLGSTNWSRFFPIGAAMMALVPVMAWWPEYSPLIHAGVTAAVMWYWAYAKRHNFGRRPDAESSPSPD